MYNPFSCSLGITRGISPLTMSLEWIPQFRRRIPPTVSFIHSAQTNYQMSLPPIEFPDANFEPMSWTSKRPRPAMCVTWRDIRRSNDKACLVFESDEVFACPIHPGHRPRISSGVWAASANNHTSSHRSSTPLSTFNDCLLTNQATLSRHGGNDVPIWCPSTSSESHAVSRRSRIP